MKTSELFQQDGVPLSEFEHDREQTLAEVLEGLRREQKHLPPKLLYDERGSQLFEAITSAPDYYLTRTELQIMRSAAGAMAARIGPHRVIIEPGSGSSEKTRILLDHLESPRAYVPVEISPTALHAAAESLNQAYPDLDVFPVCADFHETIDLPEIEGAEHGPVFYFPGSTIGNFFREEQVAFLKRVRRLVGDDGGLLIGVDLVKDPRILERAYNDRDQANETFAFNLLERLNREFDADIDPDQFCYYVFFNPQHRRIEMHLVSLVAQEYRIEDETISFRVGESILTEYSHKFTQREFEGLARKCGFAVREVWRDARGWFSVQYLTAI